jgi:hypothetical protein
VDPRIGLDDIEKLKFLTDCATAAHDRPMYTWQKVEVMKFLIMQFPPTPHYFISLWFKYSPQHPLLKYRQSGSATISPCEATYKGFV